MSDGQIVEATGLVSLIHQPTRGSAVLDRHYASEECFSAVRVLTSAVKSDHRAIVAFSSCVVRSRAKTRVRVEVMRRSPDQHAHEAISRPACNPLGRRPIRIDWYYRTSSSMG